MKSRQTSVVILITLAELAWLAAFGLLFAYRGKVGELGKMRHDFSNATNQLARWEEKAPETADLLRKLDKAQAEKQVLERNLQSFEKFLKGISPAEAASRLDAGANAEKRLAAASEEATELRRKLEASLASAAQVSEELRKNRIERENLQRKIAALPENVDGLAADLQTSLTRMAEMEWQLKQADAENGALSQKMRQRELGEYSVRRDLTGLPDGNLRRVVFLVDTSTSMKSSPAWTAATNLVRTWLEFLPVEECALVNFNDDAKGFPKDRYQRVRNTDGGELPEQRAELLKVFDKANSGTYTDLLRGLRVAYQYPKPDVLVLFTDGHPHVNVQSDAAFAKAIFAEVAKHPGVPILTVAVGSYEVEGADGPRPKINAPVSFLKELARTSGGNFLGR